MKTSPRFRPRYLGGDVILKGHFSFNKLPTIPTATALEAAGYPLAMVRVPIAVTISGAQAEDDERASIKGGSIPFYVEAPGASVTIQRLRFIGPAAKAIVVYAANGLIIANSKIEGVVPVPPLGSSAIDIDTTGTIPTLANPGHPENIFGRVLVTRNEIDVGGTSTDNTLGIVVFSVGKSPDNEADIYVVGNKIKNTTQPAINIRLIGGRVYLGENVINTGPVSAQGTTRPEVIRVANTGSYVIAHNTIDCEWAAPQAMGIGVFSQISAWIMKHAVVMDNSVTMSPPPGVIFFQEFSAGIDIRGFARDNVVANNKIRGRSKAALSVDPFQGGIPANNAFIHNQVIGFAASSADTFIGQNVADTLLLGQGGTIEDHGVGTVIVP